MENAALVDPWPERDEFQIDWQINDKSMHLNLLSQEKKAKGQLISKRLFGAFNFLQKTNKIKSTSGFIVVK